MLDSCGSDIIELGVPYSDPLADGPVIQVSQHLTVWLFVKRAFPSAQGSLLSEGRLSPVHKQWLFVFLFIYFQIS